MCMFSICFPPYLILPDLAVNANKHILYFIVLTFLNKLFFLKKSPLGGLFISLIHLLQ